jgi:hypothetical protein
MGQAVPVQQALVLEVVHVTEVVALVQGQMPAQLDADQVNDTCHMEVEEVSSAWPCAGWDVGGMVEVEVEVEELTDPPRCRRKHQRYVAQW